MPIEDQLPPPAAPAAERINRLSCPPTSEVLTTASRDQISGQTTPPDSDNEPNSKILPISIDTPSRDIPTPVNSVEDHVVSEIDTRVLSTSVASIETQIRASSPKSPSTLDYGNPFPIERFRPNTSCSYLRPGVKFTGIQRSDKAEFQVTVDIQHVDMANSFMCGYLNIRGLSAVHPTLTTYFEGEMIGTKHSFITEHPEWGASEKIDWQHWARFPAFRPIAKDAKRPNFFMRGWQQKENIWMRWKEYFIVPDHTVKDLTGASFDGFYYICFNQISGTITGAYYHAKSAQFQQIELKPEIIDHGFDYGFEFR